jgi:hypothetical protein
MPRATIPKGLSSAAVTSIPEKWSASWYRSHITNFLAATDLRNSSTGPGLIISPATGGNIASAGNIALTSEITSLLAEPYILAAAPVAGSGLTGYRTIATGSGIALNDGGAEAAFTLSLAAIATATVLGNISGAPAAPAPVSQTQLTALINLATPALSGAMPVLSGVATTYLNGTGGFSTPAQPTGANPTATIGLTAVDGTAATFLTSDSAPALSQAITPVWTGAHVFDSTIVCGAATGGAQAAGTINAVNLYVNGVAVSTSVGANPTGSVGLTAVNGVATTWMRSDAAPALNQAIAPTWTNPHIFTPAAGTAISATAPSAAVPVFNFIGLDNSNIGFFRAGGTNGGNVVFYDTGASAARGYIGFGPGGILPGGAITDFGLSAGAGGTVRITRANESANAFAVGPNGNVTIAAPSSGVALAVTGTATISSGLGVNGASAPAQVTGFGTPTGSSVVANFPGATATLVQTSETVAEILTVLKAAGIIGA